MPNECFIADDQTLFDCTDPMNKDQFTNIQRMTLKTTGEAKAYYLDGTSVPTNAKTFNAFALLLKNTVVCPELASGDRQCDRLPLQGISLRAAKSRRRGL